MDRKIPFSPTGANYNKQLHSQSQKYGLKKEDKNLVHMYKC